MSAGAVSAVTLSSSPLVSSTVKTAVPIEAATCWTMFIRGVQRVLAGHLLEVEREEQTRAEERDREERHRDDRDGHVAVLEEPQVDQRVDVATGEGPRHERHDQHGADDDGHDDLGGEERAG